jgi:hypothetical protein
MSPGNRGVQGPSGYCSTTKFKAFLKSMPISLYPKQAVEKMTLYTEDLTMKKSRDGLTTKKAKTIVLSKLLAFHTLFVGYPSG